MNYNRIASTANAARYIDQRDAETRLEVERRISLHGNKMMACGLTCQEWIDRYLKRNLPIKTVEHNTETDHDDQDRREATGTEAGPVSAGEGVGDAAGERASEEAGTQGIHQEGRGVRLDDPGNEASWIDEAWPEGSQGADFTSDDKTPF